MQSVGSAFHQSLLLRQLAAGLTHDRAAHVLQARWRSRTAARWEEVGRRQRQRELVLFLSRQARSRPISPDLARSRPISPSA
jgi:hypothetical protein